MWSRGGKRGQEGCAQLKGREEHAILDLLVGTEKCGRTASG